MSRKKLIQQPEECPSYIDKETGILDTGKLFKFMPIQEELLVPTMRGNKLYIQTVAPQLLSVGGMRSGKTVGSVMHIVNNVLLQWKGADALVLRRTFSELEKGAIKDFMTFCPKELYQWNAVGHFATFVNGSRLIFGHCQHPQDLRNWLGQSYCAVLLDEAAAWCSPEMYQLICARAVPNPGCERDENEQMPVPFVWACCNPFGIYYNFYRQLFVKREPWMFDVKEQPKRDRDGCWWIIEEGAKPRLVYDPSDYAYQRSNVFQNYELLKRDPGYAAKLDTYTGDKRDKFLLGLDGAADGAYFGDVWSPARHVNLKVNRDDIMWQPHQAAWAGMDFGVGAGGHATAVYFFTKALVRAIDGTFSLKTICFKELIFTRGATYRELANAIHRAATLDGKEIKIQRLYFSHERFARSGSVDFRTPAREFSRELMSYGLPPATQSTRNRIAGAALIYNLLKSGELVILEECETIIRAIPNLVRDPNELDDVLKVDGVEDDAYDGFRYGISGLMPDKKRPEIAAVEEQIRDLLKSSDEATRLRGMFMQLKYHKDVEERRNSSIFVQEKEPAWQSKMREQGNL